jgi:hypothetical protein
VQIIHLGCVKKMEFVIASAAKQSSAYAIALDCFVTSFLTLAALTMTEIPNFTQPVVSIRRATASAHYITPNKFSRAAAPSPFAE